MTTTAETLLDLVYAALLEVTDAGQRVYRPGDWPTWDKQYPALKLRVFSEDKQSVGRGGINFIVTATIRILGQVSAPANEDDGGAEVAEAALRALSRQVEVAVINSYPLTSKLQQFASVRSQFKFTSEAEDHLAGIQIDLGLEYYQGWEDFAPIAADAVNDVEVTASNYPPAGLSIALP